MYLHQTKYFSDKECNLLLEEYTNSAHKNQRLNDVFWDNRILHSYNLNHTIRSFLNENQATLYWTIKEFYQLQVPIYDDTLHYAIWPIGSYMPEHYDNQNSPLKYRDFASVIYLNDDYEGGEFEFTKLGKVIKPKKGDLIVFPGNRIYSHRVRKIESGNTRITIVSFWTFDPSKQRLQ